MDEATLKMLWEMLTDAQLMKLKLSGNLDDRTRFSLLSEMFRRKMIPYEEVAEPFI